MFILPEINIHFIFSLSKDNPQCDHRGLNKLWWLDISCTNYDFSLWGGRVPAFCAQCTDKHLQKTESLETKETFFPIILEKVALYKGVTGYHEDSMTVIPQVSCIT